MRRHTLLALLAIIGGGAALASDAAAEDVSSFRVTRAKVTGKTLQVEVAWQHHGDTTPVELYAHNKLPPHQKKEVIRAGVELGRFDTKAGAGTKVVSVPLKKLEKELSLAPGQTVFVAGLWPEVGVAEYGHRWGTQSRRGQTSISIPDKAGDWQAQRNSALKRGGAQCLSGHGGGRLGLFRRPSIGARALPWRGRAIPRRGRVIPRRGRVISR